MTNECILAIWVMRNARGIPDLTFVLEAPWQQSHTRLLRVPRVRERERGGGGGARMRSERVRKRIVSIRLLCVVCCVLCVVVCDYMVKSSVQPSWFKSLFSSPLFSSES